MSKPGSTLEEYGSLIYKLATLESELRHAKRLLEAPPKKPGWWKRFWGRGGYGAVAALVVALLLLPGVSHALTSQQMVLVGLKGVYILVERMDPQAERLGLTEAQIKTDVELRLRKAGVRVLTKKESFEPPGRPFLCVNVGTLFPQGALFVAYTIRVELWEGVTLARGFETFGAIWNTGMIGTVGTGNIRKLRESIGDLVDKFINDYLAANPRR